MGGGSWSDDAYAHISYSRSTSSASSSSYFKSDMDPRLDPKGVAYRESRDSADHPNSLAIMVGLDVTGSMSGVPKMLVGGAGSPGKLSALMGTMLRHGVVDPQVMFCAVGDHISDRAPIQVGQFESETGLIDDNLTSLFLEGNGGGGGSESYLLAWYFASRHTSIDCFEKRSRKGFLFTIGDEMCHSAITPDYVQKWFGDGAQEEMTAKQLLSAAQRTYEVYHIHITHHGNDDRLVSHWRDLLGERFIMLDDPNAIPELIAATIATHGGATTVSSVVADFDRRIAASVTTALARVDTSSTSVATGGGIVGL